MKLKAFDITKVKVGDKVYMGHEGEGIIIHLDKPGNYPIMVQDTDGGTFYNFTKNGNILPNEIPSKFDLMLPVTTKTYYVPTSMNFNKYLKTVVYDSYEEAKSNAKECDQIVKVEIED